MNKYEVKIVNALLKKYYKTRSINLSENNIKKIREYCKENIEENKKDKLKFSIQN